MQSMGPPYNARMQATLVSVNKLDCDRSGGWEFEVSLSESGSDVRRATLSVDEVFLVAQRHGDGPLFDWCRAIKRTPPSDYDWLKGHTFIDVP